MPLLANWHLLLIIPQLLLFRRASFILKKRAVMSYHCAMSKRPEKIDEPGKKWGQLQVAALIFLSAAVYAGTLWHGFVFDDNTQVLRNLWIRDTGSIPTIFKSNVWAFRGSNSNYYRPVMHLVYMLGYQLFGLAPWGFHLINMLLNTGATVLVFAVTGRLLRDSGLDTAGGARIPFITAAIFAVHPVHTEAVAWVASVPDLTCALFYLLSFYFYMVSRSGVARAGRAVYASVTFFFVALLSKEPAATLPAVLFGYDYAVRKCKDGPAGYLRRYMGYALAFAVYLVLRLSALGTFSPVAPTWKLGPYLVAINIPPLFAQYIGKLLLPMGMNVSHPFHPFTSLPQPGALAGMAVSLAFLAALFVSLRKRSVWAVGLLLIAVPLLPALYIPSVGRNVFADRYLYLPVSGFALLVSLAYVWAADRMPEVRQALGIFVAALVLAYSVWTVASNRVWADDIALWSHSIRMAPENSAAHDSLGEAYQNKGFIDQAMAEYRAAIALDGDNVLAHADMAAAYVKKGMLEEAAQENAYVLPRAKDNLYVLALAHSNAGAVYLKKGQMDKAYGELGEALKIDPMLLEAHSNLGALYAMRGQTDKALAHCRTAADIAPDNLEFHNNLGIVYSMAGRNDEALEQFGVVLKLNPLYPKAHNNMGITYAKMGRTDMAIREFEEALKVDPDDALLRENLRRAYESGQGGPPVTR